MKFPLLTLCLTTVSLLSVQTVSLFADPVNADKPEATVDFKSAVKEKLQSLQKQPALIHSAIGVTRKETPIPCVYSQDDLNLHTGKTRILLIGGLDGSRKSVDAVIRSNGFTRQKSQHLCGKNIRCPRYPLRTPMAGF